MKARTPIRKRRPGPPRRGRVIDPSYKAWIATLPCLICGFWPVEVAHLGERGLGQKCSDRETGPLCWTHHQDPTLGHHGELGKGWWDYHGLVREEVLAHYQRFYALRHQSPATQTDEPF